MPITPAALRSLPVGSTISGPSIPTFTVVSTAGGASTIQFILSTHVDYNKFADALDSDEVTVQFPPATTDPAEPRQVVNDLLSPHHTVFEDIREAQRGTLRRGARTTPPAPPLVDDIDTDAIELSTQAGVSLIDEALIAAWNSEPHTTPTAPPPAQASPEQGQTASDTEGGDFPEAAARAVAAIPLREGLVYSQFSVPLVFPHAGKITQRDCEALRDHLLGVVQSPCHCRLQGDTVHVQVVTPPAMRDFDCTWTRPLKDQAAFLAGVAYAKSLTH
jgi:hypothetical protein